MTAAAASHAVPQARAKDRNRLSLRYDAWLLGAVLILLVLGLTMVASASIAIGDRSLGQPFYYFWRQMAYVAVGVALGLGALRVPLVFWQRAGVALLVMGLLLLALALVPGIGREVNGSMRWISLGAVNLQPSELVKLFAVVYLAGYLVRRNEEVRQSARGFLKPMALLTLIAGLLLLEPDYGATVVLFATALAMLFLGGVPLGRFTGWMLAAAAVMSVVVLLAPYRVERLTAFMDPWADPFDSGFQLTQALIAVGRGEWLGVGLGGSVQKLFYLPEAHTDFLFAVLAEEFGLAGMILVIGLFTFVVWRAFSIARRAEERARPFSAYLAYGLGISIGLQAFTNIGVNLGVLPTKGLTLPLMSYGGSSMAASCLMLGLLLRVDHELRTRDRGI
ncbi:MAG: putative lipid II flippase FtsW [Gammaproteobacteria bacterium]|nr:putative lipid II flippase FtsW [Gammaproteobacteria bacterium]